MNTQATNGAIQARQDLLKEAKRMGLDAYESAGVVRVFDCNGGWRVVTTGRTLGQVKREFTSQRQAMQWLTRSTRHPHAY